MDWTAPRILVIAPAPTLRFTIEELLRAYGYDVTTAPSSATALHLDAEGPRSRRCFLTPHFSPCPRGTGRHQCD